MLRHHLLIIATLTAALLTGCGSAGLNWASSAAGPYSAFAKAKADGPAYQVTNTLTTHDWEKIERLTSTYASYPIEKHRPNGRQMDAEIAKAFGTADPASSNVLLHYMPGWNTGHGTPVLLVHGAIVDANSSWMTPHGQPGLAPYLADQGYRVFAVTFAHHSGDNTLQAEQIGWAIDRIKQVTGATQVDVVAHSKGTVAARVYASGIQYPWMHGYQHDIRKLVLIAGPNLGLDFTFRHPAINWGLYPEQNDVALMNAPMGFSKTLYMGVWVDTADQTMFKDGGNYFPGQEQMLYRWDKTYPLPITEQDYYTSYNGGQGFASFSEGIDKAIAEGGHYIDNLRQHPLDGKIQLAILAGNNPNLANVLNETCGPADGVVFEKSATYTDDMVKGGATLIAKSVLHDNHMDLIIQPEAHAWVGKVLAQ